MLKIRKKKLASIIALLAMFEPPYISELFPKLHLLCIVLKLVVLGVTITRVISSYSNPGRHIKLPVLYIVYCAYQLLNTLVQGQAINLAISDFCFCMYFVYACTDSRTDLFDYLDSVHLVLSVYVVINLITMILYPNGMWSVQGIGEYWFLGMDNMFIHYMYPLTVISVILLKRRFKLTYLLAIIISVATLVSRWAVTSMIGIVIFLLLAMLPKAITKRIKPQYTFIAAILVSVIVMGVYTSNWLEYIVVNVLHKDMTFSNRSFIWANALTYIGQKPLFGYGKLSSSSFSSMLEFGAHPHNMYLYQLFVNGGVGTLVYIILSFMAFKRINKQIPQNYALILSAALTGIYIMGITESAAKVFFEIPLILALASQPEKWEQAGIPDGSGHRRRIRLNLFRES